MIGTSLEHPDSRPGARDLARETLRHLAAVGLALGAVNAVIAGAREILVVGPDLAGRVLASATMVGIPVVATLRWRSAVRLIDENDRWLVLWSIVAIAAFSIDGPGDQLLLPAALAPAGMAGLFGRLKRAVGCAAIIDVGYLAVTAAHGATVWRGAGLHLVAEDALLVWLTVAITVFPVMLALNTADATPWLLRQLRLNAGRSLRALPPGPAAGARQRGLPAGAAEAALPVHPAGPILTDQELRVLRMLHDGAQYEAIAAEERRVLGAACSRHRVYRISREIKRKVGAKNLNELMGLDDSEFGL